MQLLLTVDRMEGIGTGIWNIGPQKIKSLIGHASIGRNQNKNSVDVGWIMSVFGWN